MPTRIRSTVASACLTNGGKEICDGADNDCDGVIDNGFDLQNDASNCGACGVVCTAANATSFCQQGACAFACKPGYYDADKKASDGCEYACKPTADPAEVCDGIDNDCNGLIDGDDPGLVYTPADRICYSSAAGSCQAGLTTCIAGELICVGAGPPSEEVCDGRDNNCNGVVDESDPNLGKTCYAAGVAGCDPTTGVCVGECKRGAYGLHRRQTGLRRHGHADRSKSAMARTTIAMASSTTASTPTRIRTTAAAAATSAAFAHAISVCVQGVCVFDPKEQRGGLRRRLGGCEQEPGRRLRIPVHAGRPRGVRRQGQRLQRPCGHRRSWSDFSIQLLFAGGRVRQGARWVDAHRLGNQRVLPGVHGSRKRARWDRAVMGVQLSCDGADHGHGANCHPGILV